MELIEIISGKLHGIRVTESALHYHGSITIDSDIIRAVGFIPLEFVHIWNKNSGDRISTYVLPGDAGSRTVCLNGAAARTCQVGDDLIITSWRNVTMDQLKHRKSRVIIFKHEDKINTIDEILEYNLELDKIVDNPDWKFKVDKIDKV